MKAEIITYGKYVIIHKRFRNEREWQIFLRNRYIRSKNLPRGKATILYIFLPQGVILKDEREITTDKLYIPISAIEKYVKQRPLELIIRIKVIEEEDL